MAPTAVGTSGLAWWRDLQTEQWNGPDPVIMWGRCHICVFPERAAHPIQVPECAVRHHHGGSQATVQTEEPDSSGCEDG